VIKIIVSLSNRFSFNPLFFCVEIIRTIETNFKSPLIIKYH